MRKRELLLAVGMVMATVVLTLMAIYYPILLGAFLGASVGVGILWAVRGWWRRSFAIALTTLYLGSSSLDSLAAIGSLAKLGGVLLLLIATLMLPSRRSPVWNPLQKALTGALWLMAAFAGVSVLWSHAPMETVFDGGTFFVLVFVVHKLSRTRWQDRHLVAGDLATAFGVSLAFLAAGGLLAVAGFEGTVRPEGRHQWLLNNPNMLGIMAGLTLTLGVGLAVYYRSKFLWLTLWVPTVALALAQSRTAIVAVAAGLLWVALRQGISSIIRATVVSLCCLALLQGAAVFDRFRTGDGDPLSLRTYVWDEAVQTLQSFPIGLGWAASPSTLESLYEDGATRTGIFSVHNSFLQVLLELGWAGILPLLSITIVLVAVLLRSRVDGLGAGLVGTVMVGFLVHFTESVIFGVGSPYPWLYWLVVAAAAREVTSRSEGDTSRMRGRVRETLK